MRPLQAFALLATLAYAQPFDDGQQAGSEETELVIQLQTENAAIPQVDKRSDEPEGDEMLKRQYSFPPVTITGTRPKPSTMSEQKKRGLLPHALDEVPDLVERQYSFPPVTITGHPPKPTIKDAGAKRARALRHQEAKRDGTTEIPTVTIIVKPTDMPRDAGPIAKSKRSLAGVLGDVMAKRWVVPADEDEGDAS